MRKMSPLMGLPWPWSILVRGRNTSSAVKDWPWDHSFPTLLLPDGYWSTTGHKGGLVGKELQFKNQPLYKVWVIAPISQMTDASGQWSPASGVPKIHDQGDHPCHRSWPGSRISHGLLCTAKNHSARGCYELLEKQDPRGKRNLEKLIAVLLCCCFGKSECIRL